MSSDNDTPGFAMKSVSQVLDRRVFPAGAVIFAEGQTGSIAFILLRGDVTIIARLGTPDQRTLTKVKPGQMFGELALMADSRRTASAMTESGCELLSISQEKLEQKLKEADPFVRYWIEYLSRRVIDLSSHTGGNADKR